MAYTPFDSRTAEQVAEQGRSVMQTLRNALHPICALESPYSPGTWPQPDRLRIEVDDTHALMSKRDFESLAEYSSSMPSGVYPGKMWRRHDGVYSLSGKAPEWLLMWYGHSPHPGKCSINHRKILLVD